VVLNKRWGTPLSLISNTDNTTAATITTTTNNNNNEVKVNGKVVLVLN
jgi:hypothetical protein